MCAIQSNLSGMQRSQKTHLEKKKIDPELAKMLELTDMDIKS